MIGYGNAYGRYEHQTPLPGRAVADSSTVSAWDSTNSCGQVRQLSLIQGIEWPATAGARPRGDFDNIVLPAASNAGPSRRAEVP
jgi:hypothetical protein